MPVDTDDIAISFKYFGLDPSASPEAAKEAYRRYVKEFHPDKFPAGSDAQKMAQEKMVAANAHYEKLEAFFKEHPEGRSLEEGAARQEPHNDSDWEDWQKKRQTAFDDELKDWIERQAAIEKQKTTARETQRRGNAVMYLRVGLAAAIILAWMGLYSEWISVNKEVAFLHQPHGQFFENHLDQMDTDHAREKQPEMPFKGLALVAVTYGAGWLLFSKKGKAVVDKYLAGAGK